MQARSHNALANVVHAAQLICPVLLAGSFCPRMNIMKRTTKVFATVRIFKLICQTDMRLVGIQDYSAWPM